MGGLSGTQRRKRAGGSDGDGARGAGGGEGRGGGVATTAERGDEKRGRGGGGVVTQRRGEAERAQCGAGWRGHTAGVEVKTRRATGVEKKGIFQLNRRRSSAPAAREKRRAFLRFAHRLVAGRFRGAWGACGVSCGGVGA